MGFVGKFRKDMRKKGFGTKQVRNKLEESLPGNIGKNYDKAANRARDTTDVLLGRKKAGITKKQKQALRDVYKTVTHFNVGSKCNNYGHDMMKDEILNLGKAFSWLGSA